MEISWDRLDQPAWQEALPLQAAALQHSWRYGAAVAQLGGRVQRADIRHDGQRVALAQLILRRLGPLTLAYLPRGPFWRVEPTPGLQRTTLTRLRRSLPIQGPRLLLAAPETAHPGLLPLVSPVHMAELSLGPASEMRRAMHGKWRNRLRAAERAGLEVTARAPTPADLTTLLHREAAQQRKNCYRNLPPGFIAAWAKSGSTHIRLFRARIKGEPVAEMLFLDHPPGATYTIGWTNAAGRTASAHNLLLWRAMIHFAAIGHQRLDLGSLDTVNAPGLARFKLGCGAQARALGATGPWLGFGRGKAGNPVNYCSNQKSPA